MRDDYREKENGTKKDALIIGNGNKGVEDDKVLAGFKKEHKRNVGRNSRSGGRITCT